MRKLAILAVLASTALSAPAFARDKSWYVGIEGGGLLTEDTHVNIGARDNIDNVKLKTGFDVDGIIGYDLGMFRIEGEVGYKYAKVSSHNTANTITGQPAGVYGSHGGHDDVLSFMANGLFDFGSDDGISGYVGGGAGVARVRYDTYRLNGGNVFLDGSDTRFAFQGIAGVRYPLTQHIDIGAKYRFFNVFGVRIPSSTLNVNAQGPSTARYRSHSILASLVYNFGEPPAPPPPPPPPPATPGPFIVFFDWNKSDITPEAASILDNAAQAYTTTGQASVMLAGYTDTSGTPDYNMGLSQRRADSVKAYLANKGVPAGSLSTEAFGETRLLVQTADGVREPQNRRVEITFGPGSGR